MRCLVAAGAAALVMGLGGNLYATSYPMPDRFDFGTSPPWASMQVDYADLQSRGHGSYKQAKESVLYHHLRQIAAKDWRQQLKIDRKADRSRDKLARVQTTVSNSTEPVATPTSVPDSGTTVLLLGGALCGLAVLRRSFLV